MLILQSYGMLVKKRYKMMELTSPVIPYPTLGEIHKKAGGKYYSPKLFNPGVKRLLKTIFRYRGTWFFWNGMAASGHAVIKNKDKLFYYEIEVILEYTLFLQRNSVKNR